MELQIYRMAEIVGEVRWEPAFADNLCISISQIYIHIPVLYHVVSFVALCLSNIDSQLIGQSHGTLFSREVNTFFPSYYNGNKTAEENKGSLSIGCHFSLFLKSCTLE